jgi:hypothetical protein
MPENIVYKIEMEVEHKPSKVMMQSKLLTEWKWNNGIVSLNVVGNAKESLKLDVLL